MSTANFSYGSFKQRRNDLSGAITNLKDLVQRQLDGLQVQQLDVLAQQLKSELNFNVLCVGDFSSGKTTFINKFLLHEDILPARARPTTSRLTTIRHGSALRATLIKKDGGSETIAEHVKQRIEDAVAAGGSEIENVEQVAIEIPSPVLAEGLVVVDAPGLNDPDTLRMKVTLDYLHQADAILYFLNAQQAWTRSQKEFLEETILAREDLDKLFLLLNYWDLIDNSEREDVLSYVGEELDASLDRLRKKCESDVELSRPDLIPVSAKTGENQSLVQERIWGYLASKKGQDILAYKIQRFNNYVDQYVETVAERVEFLDKDLKEREARRQQVVAEIEKYQIAKNDFMANLRRCMRHELDNFREQVSSIFDQYISLLAREIQNIQFERYDAVMVKKRLAAKLSYFQHRLASDLRKAEARLFNILSIRIEEQKSTLRIPLKRHQDWQDYFSDWSNATIVGNQTAVKAGKVFSAATALGGMGAFIGAATSTATAPVTVAAHAGWWTTISTTVMGTPASTIAPSVIMSIGIPALAVTAVGIGIYLVLRHHSTTTTEREIDVIRDEVISKLELIKTSVISNIDSDQERQLAEICGHVDNDILSYYDKKRRELDNLMSESADRPNFYELKKDLLALKLAVNL